MGIYLKILAFTALVISFAAFAPKDNACATTIAPQTCDTQVWRAMNNRARIETEREIMQNQNLIYKPDSILAYTCFDSMAAHIGATAGVLFTHTSYWSPMPIQWGAPNGMDNAVNTVVTNAIRTYFTANFNHTMLGGRGASGATSTPSGMQGGLGLPMHQVSAVPSRSSTYSCGVMRDVWRVAKCMNFLHTSEFAATDGYYPFINIQGLDGDPNVDGYETIRETRRYPASLSCGTGEPFSGTTWQLEYLHSRNETAFGSPNFHYQYGSPLDDAFRMVRQRIAPVGSPIGPGNAVASCADDVPTGITVILSPGTEETHPDGVCTNPGCTYSQANGGACVNSIVSAPSIGPGIGPR